MESLRGSTTTRKQTSFRYLRTSFGGNGDENTPSAWRTWQTIVWGERAGVPMRSAPSLPISTWEDAMPRTRYLLRPLELVVEPFHLAAGLELVLSSLHPLVCAATPNPIVIHDRPLPAVVEPHRFTDGAVGQLPHTRHGVGAGVRVERDGELARDPE